jgi:hypothetical protein
VAIRGGSPSRDPPLRRLSVHVDAIHSHPHTSLRNGWLCVQAARARTLLLTVSVTLNATSARLRSSTVAPSIALSVPMARITCSVSFRRASRSRDHHLRPARVTART